MALLGCDVTNGTVSMLGVVPVNELSDPIADLSGEEYSDVERSLYSLIAIHEDELPLMLVGMPSVAIPNELIPALLPVPQPLNEVALQELIAELREELDES